MDDTRRTDVPGAHGTRPHAADPPLGDLLRALSRDAATLVRQELALARAELRHNVRSAARDAALVVLGGCAALLGVLVLLAALVVAAGGWLGGRYALAALAVGLALVALGGAGALIGVRRARRTSLAPELALASLRDTGGWARAQAQELRATLAGSADPDDALPSAAMDRNARGGSASTRTSSLAAASTTRTGSGDADSADVDSGDADSVGSESADADRQRGGRGKGALPVSAPLWKRVAHEYGADDLGNQAAKVAYYFFLSLPPALMALFGLTGLFGGAATGDWLTERLTTSLPAEASALVTGFVSDIVHRDAPGPISIGLLLALWAGSNVFSALADTLNAAFGIAEKRSFVRRKAVAVGMLAACAVLFLSGSAVLLGGGAFSDALGLGAAGRTAWAVLQVPLGFGLITATFWLIYYVLPNRDQRGCRGVLLRASAVAAALFVAASLGFRFYMAHFGSYSATYGLLGTVIVLLLWMYVTSLVILLGGEVASEMERA